jgi:hypothetical protein
MSRPPLGGGRSHPQCRSCLHRTKSPVAQLGTSKCCWPLRAVASPHSAVISMNAPAAGIAPPSPTTAVAIDTPKCQTAARERWIAAPQRELLPTRYVHVVFTLPPQLAPLALRIKKSSTICCSAPVLDGSAFLDAIS